METNVGKGYFVQLTLTHKESHQPRTVSVINIPLRVVHFSTKKQVQFFPSLSESRCFFILGLLTFNFSYSMVVLNHLSLVLLQNALNNRFGFESFLACFASECTYINRFGFESFLACFASECTYQSFEWSWTLSKQTRPLVVGCLIAPAVT